MLSLVLRGFTQRKLRVLLTGIAIALGVALMAGTYILTDTINQTFAGIFQTANRGHDVVITPNKPFGNKRVPTSPITEQTLARVRGAAGVAEASGSIFSVGTLLSIDGKRLSTGGAPAFVVSEVPKRFESFTVVHGRFPADAEEVAIDEATANRESLRIGEQVLVAGAAPAKPYTIVAIMKFAGGQSFGGASAALLTLAEAQRVAGEQGRYDQIDVAAQPGVTPSELRDRIRAILPSTVVVRTGSQQAATESSELESNLSFLRTFLLVFAYVALGGRGVHHLQHLLDHRRTAHARVRTAAHARRLAPADHAVGRLRRPAAGCGRRRRGPARGHRAGPGAQPAVQVVRCGPPQQRHGAPDAHDRGLARGRDQRDGPGRARAGGAGHARASARGDARGGPAARRACSRGAARSFAPWWWPPSSRPTPRKAAAILGAALAGLAIYILLLRARLRRGGLPRRPRVVPALARAIGLLVRWRGITGRLAEENSMRQPGRTMITAASLTVGLALVTLVAVLADGTKATIDRAVNRSFAGNLIVENSSVNSEATIPAVLAPALRRVPGVATVTPIAFTVGRLKGSTGDATITAIEPETFAHAYRVEWAKGSNATLLALDGDGAIATKGYASSHHLHVGQTVSVLTPTNRRVPLRILGIASDNARLLGNLTVCLALARTAFGQRDDALDFVSYANGVSNAQVQPAVNRLLASAFPQARSRTAAQFKQDQANQINTLLTLIYVLLALSVIVSLFGIVNTLILSIYERTRELGMMRAIGASRRQIRQMIRYESVITALIGGVFGLVIGVVGALLVTTFALSGSGYVQSIPVGTLLVLLLVAALAGVIAAQLPARRAARLDPLSALAAE